MVVSVVPVEVRDALLQSKEIVDCGDDNVDGGRVASLRSEVVLKVGVVSLAKKLEESKQALCEEMVRENLTENCREGSGQRIQCNY